MKNRLETAAVHFSTSCGCACEFCYAAESPARHPPPVSLRTIEQILARLVAEGVREILFLGGDPVLHPQFIESLQIAKAYGLATTVLSNSWTLPDDEEAEHIVTLVDYCETTILGASPAMHDALTRQPGSFTRLATNLQRLASAGKRIGLCLNVMPVNLHHIFEIVRQFQQEYHISLRSVMIQRIIPSGRASNGRRKFMLDVADVAILMTQLHQIAAQFDLPILFEDPLPWCVVDPQYHQYLGRCEWGFTKGSINSEGFLTRCAAGDQYYLGSIWDGSLQDIWQTHPLLEAFRAKRYLPEECQQCALLDQCGGGCALSCGALRELNPDDLYLQARTGRNT